MKPAVGLRIRKGIAALSIIGAGMCVLIPVAGSLSGSSHALLEAVADWRWQFGVIGLAMFVLSACARNRTAIAIAALGCVYHASQLLPWYLPARAQTTGMPFKAISFNVLFFNERYDDVIAFIRAERPLVVALQEANAQWSERLKPLRAEMPHHYRVDHMDIEVFSRAAIVDPQVTTFGKIRGFVRFRVEHGDGTLVVIATHAYPMRAYGDEGFRHRNDHLRVGLPSEVNRFKNEPLLVLGDLNATMWSPAYRELIHRTGLRNARKGFGVLPTGRGAQKPMPLAGTPIDHCLVNEHVAVANCRTGAPLGSDHLPIIVDLAPVSQDR